MAMAIGKIDNSERAYADVLNAQKTSKDSGDLTMDDYLSLIVAEMTSQDALNPDTDTSAMVNQMVSMTTVQAMNDMVKSTNAQYSASLIGKKVTVATYDENGKYFQDTGIVQSVIMATDEPTFIVNDKKYTLSNIMEVNTELAET